MDVWNLIIAVAGVLLSCVVAWKYGDVAAVRATRKFHEEDAKKARLTALQSLMNEVARIRKLVEHNSQLLPLTNAPVKSLTKMPIAAFETAFVSGRHGLAVSSHLLNAVTDYFTHADSINLLVDIYVAGIPSGTAVSQTRRRTAVHKIAEICTDELPRILDQLETHLQHELEPTGQ